MSCTVQELYNKLCLDRKVRLQVEESDVANLHSRLCRVRSAEDNLFKAIGEENPMILASSQIYSRVIQHTHLEDGTKMCIVEFVIKAKETRRFTLLPLDSETGDDPTG